MRIQAYISAFLCLSLCSLARAGEDLPEKDGDESLRALIARIDGPEAPVAPEVAVRDAQGRVTLRAVRLSEPLTLDGRLEENVYRTTSKIDRFIQQEPHEGEPATDDTDVWVFFDDRNVYVSARCWDRDPESIVANELRRDSRGIFNNDNFAVILDTFYDRRNGFVFYTNPLGALYDAQVTDERNVNSDWNTVWDVKTARFAEGWTVEFAIPFKSLRYRPGRGQVWGVNFRRIVRSTNEFSYLTPIPAAYRQGGLMKLSRAATLVGIEAPAGSLNFEIKPYATAGSNTDLEAETPFRNDLDANAGLDVKYGLTKSLVADFTVNTDFAQVEADDQQVNLTRFSLFFPEKREFFLEGQGIFDFGGTGRGGRGGGRDVPILFFSRRIGLQDETEVPIRAGGRLTGRAGPYTLGFLDIQTGGVSDASISPTNFAVARMKRDIFRRSNIGVIATHRSRSVDYGGSNSVLGFDAAFSFFENLNITTFWATSRTGQKGDLEGNNDSYLAQVGYGGDRYGFNFSHLAVGDAFHPEVGYLRREDIRKTSGHLRFSPRPTSIPSVRKFSYEARFDYYENGSGEVETRKAELQFGADFERGDELNVEYMKNYELLVEPFEITGEITVPVGGYDFDRYRVSYRIGPQSKVSGRVGMETGGFYSGTRREIFYFGRVEVTPRLSIEPDVSQNWIDLLEGSFTTTLVRLRSTYSVSARSFIGGLVQYNTSNDSLSMNFRYRWEYEPGSDLYVVYTDSRDILGTGFPGIETQSLVVKFTHLFRF